MASHSSVARAYNACVALLFCTALAVSSDAQTFTNLFTFEGTNGEYPLAPLVQGRDGNLYGTSAGDGISDGGTVFKITTKGALTTLHSFEGTDGFRPYAGLVQAADGNLYGTTYNGGASSNGTAFKITPTKNLTVLHSFCQTDCTDGANPVPGLTQGGDGDFYGTAMNGGTGYGTVFKMTRRGEVTTLHIFDGTDGAYPESGLVQTPDGNFYGTTYSGGGGLNCFKLGCGTVFKVTPEGKFTTLYVFCEQSYCPDGSQPVGTLVEGSDGEFYGTTSTGGVSYDTPCDGGCGTVFKITSLGKLTTLYRFCTQSGCTDGTLPTGSLVQATNDNFYGTTLVGGGSYNCDSYGPGCGSVFEITPTGQLTTLFDFGNGDAGSPWAGLVQDTDGSFYGTTTGGTANLGTIFSIAVGLRPFVKTLPAWGEVGTAVEILGTRLKGATEVMFNETAGVFTVVSNTEIKASVPRGATTGFVTVTTPGGTLKSNEKFRVIQ